MKKVILPFLLLGCSIVAQGQQERLPQPEPYFMAIIVSDIDTSIAWYKDHLGFALLNRTDLPDLGFRQANLESGKTLLELIELNSARTAAELLADHPRGTRVGGFFKFGFSVADFDGWLSYLKKSNVSFRGDVVKDPNTGKRMIILLDPDGNRIQFFEQ